MAHQAELVTRLLALGATPGRHRSGRCAGLRAPGATDLDVGQGDVSWTCLADPEGHQFRVLNPC